MIEINEESEQRAEDESNAKQILVNEDKARANEMRKRAMEMMGETKARTGERCKKDKTRVGWAVISMVSRSNQNETTTG